MSNVQYIPLEEEKATPTPAPVNVEEIRRIRKSSGMVVFLCFIQLMLALLALFGGNIILMCVSAFFISMGIVGAARQRVPLLVAHFVYSLVLYILSLISLVFLVYNCAGDCAWYVYLIGFLIVLSQAIGMRHSRMLISALRVKQGGSPCLWRCRSRSGCAKNTPAKVEANIEMEKVNTPEVAPGHIQGYPMYPIPAHQFVAMQMQPRLPQYYPFQPVQYPMMQQPSAVPQQMQQLQMQQMQQFQMQMQQMQQAQQAQQAQQNPKL